MTYNEERNQFIKTNPDMSWLLNRRQLHSAVITAVFYILNILYTEFSMFKKLNTYLDYIEDTQRELQEMRTI